jgi:hypothetical protein
VDSRLMLGVLTSNATKEAPVSEQYAGKQIVGIDLHRRRSVLVRMTEAGEHLETVRVSNDPSYLREVMARAGEAPEVVLEATYGWYWAADALICRPGCQVGRVKRCPRPSPWTPLRLPDAAGGGERVGDRRVVSLICAGW